MWLPLCWLTWRHEPLYVARLWGLVILYGTHTRCGRCQLLLGSQRLHYLPLTGCCFLHGLRLHALVPEPGLQVTAGAASDWCA